MKMILIKNVFVKSWAFSFPALALMTSSLTSPPEKLTSAESSTALQARFLGGNNQVLLFDVKYDNKAGGTFKLMALDDSGEACFQDNFTNKYFERKIEIPRLIDTDYVTFLIRSAKENIQLSYKVKVTTKVVDETVFLKNRELVSYK